MQNFELTKDFASIDLKIVEHAGIFYNVSAMLLEMIREVYLDSEWVTMLETDELITLVDVDKLEKVEGEDHNIPVLMILDKTGHNPTIIDGGSRLYQRIRLNLPATGTYMFQHQRAKCFVVNAADDYVTATSQLNREILKARGVMKDLGLTSLAIPTTMLVLESSCS